MLVYTVEELCCIYPGDSLTSSTCNMANCYPTELLKYKQRPKRVQISRGIWTRVIPSTARKILNIYKSEFWEKENERGRWEEAILKFFFWDKCMLSPLPIHSFYFWFRNDTWHSFILLGSSRTHQASKRFFIESPINFAVVFVIFHSSKNGFPKQN